MKHTLFIILIFVCASCFAQQGYVPSEANLRARVEFRQAGLGIFFHWGIYSMFGHGEWIMSVEELQRDEYAKAASAFYPARFDADRWIRDVKASGAKYICFTSRHHDGFSMWRTKQSGYNIYDATPYHHDVLKDIAKACKKHGIKLHLYYSLVDWGRDDYPMGESCRKNGKDSLSTGDYNHYMQFMKAQLTELLTQYGEIGAIWFDGEWDHEHDSIPFDWRMPELYELIHRLQPACLVANNHHHAAQPGEDIQCFERDIPGENTAGYSGNSPISETLPLETCQTMNWSWGYRVTDTYYKSVDEIRQLMADTRAKGANLLINVGPQPNGEMPATAIERLHQLPQK